MPKVTIDDKIYDAPEGKLLLQFCIEQGILVPFFCYHEKLSIAGNCRMCLVEVEGRPKLEISCNTVIQEGMVVRTKSPKVLEARKSVLEFILINHPLDCPICDQAGECKLQDQYFDYSGVPYRFREEKVHKPKAVPLGPLVMLDDERCIVCTRCVRFCDEVPKVRELGVAERGDHSKIVTFQNEGMKNAYALNTVDICPVGALTNRDFRFNKRVWFLKNTPSICTGCATGCNIWMDHDGGVVYRYRPRENADVNQCWMCDEGRLTYKFINAPDRIMSPHYRTTNHEPQTTTWQRTTWDAALKPLHAMLQQVPPTDRGVVLSAQCSNEENFAWWWLAKEQWKTTHIFGTGRQFADATEDQLLRRADKNPNTRGLQALHAHRPYAGGCRLLVVLDTLTPEEIALVQQHRPEYVVVLATNWGVDPSAVRWRPLSEVQDILSHGGAADTLAKFSADGHEARGTKHEAFPWADLVLPLATFAEQSGSFMNFHGHTQSFDQAMPPKGESQPAWQIAARVAALEQHALSWSNADEILRAMKEIVR